MQTFTKEIIPVHTKKKSLQRGHKNLNKVLLIQKLFHEAGRGNWKSGETGENADNPWKDIAE